MREGEIVQFGRTIDVYNRPRSLYAAGVFSDPPINTAQITLAGGEVAFASGDIVPARGLLSELVEGQYRLAFRPHQLMLGSEGGDHLYTFTAKVVLSEITGSESFVHLTWSDHEWVAVAAGVHDLAPGARLVVGVDPNNLFVFDQSGRLAAAPRWPRGAAD